MSISTDVRARPAPERRGDAQQASSDGARPSSSSSLFSSSPSSSSSSAAAAAAAQPSGDTSQAVMKARIRALRLQKQKEEEAARRGSVSSLASSSPSSPMAWEESGDSSRGEGPSSSSDGSITRTFPLPPSASASAASSGKSRATGPVPEIRVRDGDQSSSSQDSISVDPRHLTWVAQDPDEDERGDQDEGHLPSRLRGYEEELYSRRKRQIEEDAESLREDLEEEAMWTGTWRSGGAGSSNASSNSRRFVGDVFRDGEAEGDVDAEDESTTVSGHSNTLLGHSSSGHSTNSEDVSSNLTHTAHRYGHQHQQSSSTIGSYTAASNTSQSGDAPRPSLDSIASSSHGSTAYSRRASVQSSSSSGFSRPTSFEQEYDIADDLSVYSKPLASTASTSSNLYGSRLGAMSSISTGTSSSGGSSSGRHLNRISQASSGSSNGVPSTSDTNPLYRRVVSGSGSSIGGIDISAAGSDAEGASEWIQDDQTRASTILEELERNLVFERHRGGASSVMGSRSSSGSYGSGFAYSASGRSTPASASVRNANQYRDSRSSMASDWSSTSPAGPPPNNPLPQVPGASIRGESRASTRSGGSGSNQSTSGKMMMSNSPLPWQHSLDRKASDASLLSVDDATNRSTASQRDSNGSGSNPSRRSAASIESMATSPPPHPPPAEALPMAPTLSRTHSPAHTSSSGKRSVSPHSEASRYAPSPELETPRMGISKLAPADEDAPRRQATLRPDEVPASAPANMLHFASTARLSPAEEHERRRDSLLRKSLGGLMSAVDQDMEQWHNSEAQILEDLLAEEEKHEARESEAGDFDNDDAASVSTRATERPGSTYSESIYSSEAPSNGARTPEPPSEEYTAAFSRPQTSQRNSSLTTHSVLAPAMSADSYAMVSSPRSSMISTSDVSRSSTPTISAVSLGHRDVDDVEDEEVDSDDSLGTAIGITPRKRQKQKSKKKWGFEEQRAAAPTLRSHTSRLANAPLAGGAFTVGMHYNPNDVGARPSTDSESQGDGIEQFKYYEFSPDLPPFAAGLKPKDLTGAGTWAGLVARAGSKNAWEAHRASVASNQTVGPISMRQVAAEARWRQEQAKRDKERQAQMLASISLSPVDLLKHAESHASMRSSASNHSVYSSVDMSSSRGSVFSFDSGSLYGAPTPLREGSDAMSITSGSGSPGSVVGLGIQHPMARPEKVYAEVSMQTSPTNSPPGSRRASVELAELDEEVLKRQASALNRRTRTTSLVVSDDEAVGSDRVGASKRAGPRRKTVLAKNLPDLDWPPELRVPRLSTRYSMASMRSTRSSVSTRSRNRSMRKQSMLSRSSPTFESDGSDSGESDLDVSVSLDELAEKSGIMEALGEVRGAKRKLGAPSLATLNSDTETSTETHNRLVKPMRRSMLSDLTHVTGKRDSVVTEKRSPRSSARLDIANSLSPQADEPSAKSPSARRRTIVSRIPSPELGGGSSDEKEDLLDDDGWMEEQLKAYELDGSSSPRKRASETLGPLSQINLKRQSGLSADHSHGHSADLHNVSDQSTLGHGSGSFHATHEVKAAPKELAQPVSKVSRDEKAAEMVEKSASALAAAPTTEPVKESITPSEGTAVETMLEAAKKPEAGEIAGALSDVTDTPDTAASGPAWSEAGPDSRRSSNSSFESSYSALSTPDPSIDDPSDSVKTPKEELVRESKAQPTTVEESSPDGKQASLKSESSSVNAQPSGESGSANALESLQSGREQDSAATNLASVSVPKGIPVLNAKKSISKLRAPSSIARPRSDSTSSAKSSIARLRSDSASSSKSSKSSPTTSELVPDVPPIPKASLMQQRRPSTPAEVTSIPKADAPEQDPQERPIKSAFKKPNSQLSKGTGIPPITPRKSLPAPSPLKARPSVGTLPRSRIAPPEHQTPGQQPAVRRLKSVGDLRASPLQAPSADSMPTGPAAKPTGLQTPKARKSLANIPKPTTPVASGLPRTSLPTPSSKKAAPNSSGLPRPSGLPTPSRKG